MQQILEQIDWEQYWEWTWPKLLWGLSPLFFIIKLLLRILFFLKNKVFQFFIWLWIRLFYDRKISDKTKCPSCGIREIHPIEFHPGYEKVIHSCKHCKAEWGEEPIVSTAKWLIKVDLEKKEE